MKKKIVINAVLPELLKAKSLTPKKLSELSGVPLSTISTWMTSTKNRPRNLDYVAATAAALNITIDALLYGEAVTITDIDAVPQQQILKGVYYIDLRKIDLESHSKIEKKK